MTQVQTNYIITSNDLLQRWRSQHFREDKLLAMIELDWPGTRNCCSNLISHVRDKIEGTESQGVIVDHCLSTALKEYQNAIDTGADDPERLRVFINALLVEFGNLVHGGEQLSVELASKLIPGKLLLKAGYCLPDEVN